MGRKLYEVLTYIENNSNVSIVTDLLLGTHNYMEIKFNPTTLASGNNYRLYSNNETISVYTANAYMLGNGFRCRAYTSDDKRRHTHTSSFIATNKDYIVKINGDENTYYINNSQLELEEPSQFSDRESGNLIIFNDDEAFIGKISYLLFKSGDTILYDIVPVRRLSDSKIGIYDKVTKQFFTNEEATFIGGTPTGEYIYEEGSALVLGTNDATLLMGNSVAPLKGKNKKYKLLDYIQSSGTQYLLTTLKPKGTEHFKIKFIPLEWSASTNNVICGARTSANGIFVFGSIAEAYGGGARLANYGYNASISKPTLNVEHTVEYINEKMYYDGTEYIATNRQLVQINSPMAIFAGNTDGEVNAHTKMKLTGYEEYDTNGNLTHNWVPAQRVSDSAIGMYDTVARTFIANSGTGTFTYGSVVQDYIEEDVEQVEYVENTSESYIDIEYPNFNYQDWKIEGRLNITRKDNNNAPTLFGAAKTEWSKSSYGVVLEKNSNNITTRQGGYGTIISNKATNLINTWHNFIYTAKNGTNGQHLVFYKEDGTVDFEGTSSFNGADISAISPTIFQPINVIDSAKFFMVGKLGFLKIYSGDSLVRDYLPVKVGSEYCMYDRVSGELFFNAGTGAFTGGGALPVTKIYLGSTRLQ